MNATRLFFLLAMSSLALSACADRQAAGPTVTLEENGNIRKVSAEGFNEAAYLKRGYIKNTDAHGNPIYVFIADTDRPYEPTIGGNTGEGILWYGDRGGGQGRGGMGAVGIGGGNGYN